MEYVLVDNWAKCTRCGLLTKGVNEQSTLASICRHLREVHNIRIYDDGISDVNAPLFIPPDRKGLSPVQPKRFDHPRNIPAEGFLRRRIKD